jgi:hypothetical protein
MPVVVGLGQTYRKAHPQVVLLADLGVEPDYMLPA